MTRRPPRARRRLRRAAAWIAATIAGGSICAQSVGNAPAPIGFPAGPFVIAPSLTTGYAYNSNVFMNSESAAPSPDEVLTLQPVLQLILPFSNSWFRFGDTLTWLDYNETPQTAGHTSNDAVADLTLNFGSRDRLALAAHHINGVADTLAFDPGGEVRFEGNAFKFHNEGVFATREIDGVPGYRFSLQRSVLKFDPSPTIAFFNFSGFDGEGAYLQPLSSSMRISFGYLGSRYDHYDISPGSDPHAIYRTESGDAIFAQLEGRLGPRQPYSVRLGWERLDFTGNTAKNFSGLIGRASLSAIVGGGTTLTVTAERQPYRSFFEDNNFYVYDAIGGRVERRFPRGSVVGGDALFSRGTYQEPSPPGSALPGNLRDDRTIWLEAYANLAIRDRVVFRLLVTKNRRYTNQPGADFNVTVVFGGFIFGWI